MAKRRSERPFSTDGLESIALPSHDEVAARAYEAYRKRGSANGWDLDDWLEAERALLEEREQATRGVGWPVGLDQAKSSRDGM